jgi:hypothetical protein
MRRQLLALSGTALLTGCALAAAVPADAEPAPSPQNGGCVWGTDDWGTKPARHTIMVHCGDPSISEGYGSVVYFYNSSSGGTTYRTKSAQRVTDGTVQAIAASYTIFAYGGAWQKEDVRGMSLDANPTEKD